MSAGCGKFAMLLCHTLLYLGGAIPLLSHAVTPMEQAFLDGQAAAQSAASGASTSITNGTIATTVNSFDPNYYNYSATAPEAGYFMNGGGDTITPGAGKVTACQTGPVNPNAFLQQNCDAINYMARNPAIRPQFTLTPGDPNVARSRSIEANPATLAANSLGYASPSAIGAFTGCTTQTITTPPTYTTEVCNEYLNATSHLCTVGRTIVVDADSNYQCSQTAKSYETLSCRRGSTVTIGFGQCTPGAWLGRVAYVDCARCVDPYMAMNVFCGSDGRSYEVEPYRSYDGVNRFDYNTVGYPWNGSYGRFPVAVAPGQSVTDYYVSNLGFGCNLYVYFSVNCGATTCTPTMRNVSSGCSSSGGTGTGAPLQLPMSKTVSNWTSNECVTLQQRAQ